MITSETIKFEVKLKNLENGLHIVFIYCEYLMTSRSPFLVHLDNDLLHCPGYLRAPLVLDKSFDFYVVFWEYCCLPFDIFWLPWHGQFVFDKCVCHCSLFVHVMLENNSYRLICACLFVCYYFIFLRYVSLQIFHENFN